MLGGSRADIIKKSSRPKGRQLSEDAIEEVRSLLGDEPRRRDLLIEFLHRIQDRHGHLGAAHLKALAVEMRLSEAEIFEVASFYHHFDIVKDDEEAPAPVTVRVCDSLSCELAGADNLIAALEAGCDPANVRIIRAPCQGRCAEAPSACVGRREVGYASVDAIGRIIDENAIGAIVPGYIDLEQYRAEGGYSLYESCLRGERTPEELVEMLSDAGLRGLGGAGFPAGKKWQIVRSFEGPRLMTVNGDEGEPGTFKDRYYLERDPHRMLEGALVAAWAVEAERLYIYMRDEYPGVLEVLKREVEALTDAGLCDLCPIEIRRGAGAYICGEESAMIESIEGKRGLPRHRPPYIAEVGLFGRPTLNHNVETLYWIRTIVEKGPGWFANQGKEGHKGLRSFSVSGRVAEPGVKIVPAGTSIDELIEACGGMAEGHEFRAFLPGGASGGIFPASMSDMPLDFGTFEPHGGFVGSHAVVILSHKDDLKKAALNLLRFFKHESCGQCTPCRSGTEKMVAVLEAGDWDPGLLSDLEQVMRDASICGLGQAAPNPVRSVLRIMQEEAGQ
ncbi:NAD(P)H-dependent oxidoreductase subunit E [Rhizobiales bacterium]|uniref:NADH-ubiquinone oxidoreductase-F iron-sulfur binding region domain-containing protein n=1 Tax=Hongsoonwoonella zoysiae TaxID=2821844 RepID=UPI00155F89D7|nr:NADH-ubiquinone oxidoreductase-F iron-sulfur binding region domain-containing protein [Hongsoonwoonella zoysiae]NRG19477.1 NAD(P)H-dependent oxidoreductase subunit E [Hongsoonwoonella zoysiae]